MSTVWILEWQFKGPNYWLPGHHTNFTTDAAQAVHFADKRSAEIVAKDLGLTECEAKEHEFVSTTRPDSDLMEKLEATIERQGVVISEQMKDLVKYREALEFYAKGDHTYSHPENAVSDYRWDAGKRAKDALSARSARKGSE